MKNYDQEIEKRYHPENFEDRNLEDQDHLNTKENK